MSTETEKKVNFGIFEPTFLDKDFKLVDICTDLLEKLAPHVKFAQSAEMKRIEKLPVKVGVMGSNFIKIYYEGINGLRDLVFSSLVSPMTIKLSIWNSEKIMIRIGVFGIDKEYHYILDKLGKSN